MVDLSVALPVFNEKENLPELYSKLKGVLKKLKKSYEIIFVDDGSTDGSYNVMKEIQKKDNRVKIIKFGRNFGKSTALSAAFKKAGGDLIITMDADLQDDPEEIPKFLKKINQGFDLVVGWRFKRNDSITKRLPSKMFNLITSIITGINLHDFNCGYKVCRRKVAENINLYGELHRYIPVLAVWKGYSVGEVKVKHRPRRFGKSKYGFTRLVKGLLDLITVKFLTTYAKRPLHFFGFFGILSFLLGVVSGIYVLYLKFIMNSSIGDRPLLILTVLMIVVGVQFISLGLLGEMIVSRSEVVEDEGIDFESAK